MDITSIARGRLKGPEWQRFLDAADALAKGQEPESLSFAAIPEKPEREVAAVGHDRTIINFRLGYIENRPHPESGNPHWLYRSYDGEQHPCYQPPVARAT